MGRRSADGEYWGLRDAWQAFRNAFWPAWRWGLVNALVWVVGIWNLIAYWQAPGAVWFALRFLWIAVLTLVMLASVLVAISLVTTLPFTLALMCWLALLGTTVVQSSLALQEERPGG